MQTEHGILLLILLVCTARGLKAQNETSDPEMEDEDAVVAELARRLRPLEDLEAKQRRLEELEAMKRMQDNLETSHRSLDAAETHRGCGGGCSKGQHHSRTSEELEEEYSRDLRPRPIFGLLNEILETARAGYKIDRPRSHFIF